jgi:hypothetical protein
MRTMKTVAMVAVAAMLSLGTVKSEAQVPGPHPAYLHALSDLRAARAYLSEGFQWGPVREEDNHAIREIDAAIERIKQASIDDGKRLGDHPPVDTHLEPRNRFAKANELLFAAHRDLEKAEDVPQSRGLRDDALRHIDAAHNIVDQAVRTAKWQ